MSAITRDSEREAMALDIKHELARAEQARREAIYEARDAEGDRPTLPVAEPRDKLPTLDDLTGPEAPRARWKLALVLAAALGGLGELAHQIATLLSKH